MVILDRLKDAGTLAKGAFVTLLVAMLFVWIAYTCPGWGGYGAKTESSYTSHGQHFGLWRLCNDEPPCVSLDGWPLDWFIAVQAFVTFGFLGINIGLLLVILYIYNISCQRNAELGMVASIVCCVTAGLYTVGVVTFAVRYRRDYIERSSKDYIYGYCFVLSILAILLEGSAGLFMFLDTRLNGRSSTESQQLVRPSQCNPTYGVHLPAGSQQAPAEFQATPSINQQGEMSQSNQLSNTPNAGV